MTQAVNFTIEQEMPILSKDDCEVKKRAELPKGLAQETRLIKRRSKDIENGNVEKAVLSFSKSYIP